VRALLEKLKHILDIVLEWSAIIIFSIIFLVVLLQIAFRYFLNSPLVWTEELSRYLFIWISFLGWVFATRNGSHIRISALLDAMPKSIRQALSLINDIFVIVLAVIMTWQGIIMTARSTSVPTITLFFSFALVYAAVPISSIFIILYTVLQLLGIGKSNGDESQDKTKGAAI